MKRINFSKIGTHAVLIFWCLVVLFPIWTMLINSVKPKREIFRDPFGLPSQFTGEGYSSVWTQASFNVDECLSEASGFQDKASCYFQLFNQGFAVYFRNSIVVTVVSLLLIVFLGSLAAYGLAQWRTRISGVIYILFIAGLMIPIRLGTINLLQVVQSLGLLDTIWALIPVYVAMGLPIATFVLTSFIRSLPKELHEAAQIDGASEWRIYWSIILPLIRPALATVTIFNMLPIWNDLWFPLIFIRSDSSRTVTYGVSLLFGQYQTDWTRALSALSLAAVPVLLLYVLMSNQFIKGLTAGAVKQ